MLSSLVIFKHRSQLLIMLVIIHYLQALFLHSGGQLRLLGSNLSGVQEVLLLGDLLFSQETNCLLLAHEPFVGTF